MVCVIYRRSQRAILDHPGVKVCTICYRWAMIAVASEHRLAPASHRLRTGTARAPAMHTTVGIYLLLNKKSNLQNCIILGADPFSRQSWIFTPMRCRCAVCAVSRMLVCDAITVQSSTATKSTKHVCIGDMSWCTKPGVTDSYASRYSIPFQAVSKRSFSSCLFLFIITLIQTILRKFFGNAFVNLM